MRELGLRDAVDPEIFQAARKVNAVVMTKDRDFINLLEHQGPLSGGEPWVEIHPR